MAKEKHIHSTVLDSVLTSSQILKFHQHFGNLCRQRKHQLDGMVKYSMKMNTTFLQKLEILRTQQKLSIYQ